MHILSILLSFGLLFIAIEVIRQTIASQSDPILDALSGVAPVRQGSAAVVVPFRARPRVSADQAESVRLAA